jgi:hypothetical protein
MGYRCGARFRTKETCVQLGSADSDVDPRHHQIASILIYYLGRIYLT